jgi:hypothetical protein
MRRWNTLPLLFPNAMFSLLNCHAAGENTVRTVTTADGTGAVLAPDDFVASEKNW